MKFIFAEHKMGLVKGAPLLHFIFFTWLCFTLDVRSAELQRSTYIIHMDKSLMPKAFTSHQHWYSSILDSLKASGSTKSYGLESTLEIVYTYDNAFHGFSATLSPDELETLKKVSGYLSAYKDRSVTLDTTHTFEFLSLNPVSGLWPAADYGKDVIVGVIDTGIWPESESFKDDGMTPIPSRWKGTCEEGQEFNSSMYLPLVYNKTISACNSSELLPPRAITLCEIGDLKSQIDTVAMSQAAGAIFVSNMTRIYVNCPGIIISPKDAQAVIKYATTDAQPTATIKFQKTFLGVEAATAPAVAAYSSRGPSPSYSGILKPDILAPGSNVFAAWLPDTPDGQVGSNLILSTDYILASGTSMACPHAAAVAALLKGAHPEWSPAGIRSAIMTTANPLDNTMNPIMEEVFNGGPILASPLAMGAGHVDPNRALDPGLIYDATPQDYVNLLCSMNFTQTQILAITRSRNYNCTPEPDVNYPSFIALYDNSTNTISRLFHRMVTNVGDGAATYNAKVVAPPGTEVSVAPDTLVFKNKYEKQSYTLSLLYKQDKNQSVFWGSLEWVETNGNHSVRSPIVLSAAVSW
ncbi:Peptidase S8 propeptide/proteinase inhibitor I9 [Dillenia turbinata]|uniref:Peptidase S8 propeptide/proteinase inhibitor I9 n=1 Tax=Dillenia turbinata TaxID=194707 RepID=A0AAN8ZMG2_9MAGN